MEKSNDDPKWEKVIAALRKSDELKELAAKLEKVLKTNQQVSTTVAGKSRLHSHQDSNKGKQCLRYALNCCTNKRRLAIFKPGVFAWHAGGTRLA